MKVKLGRYESDWKLEDFAPLPFYGIMTHHERIKKLRGKAGAGRMNKLSTYIDYGILGAYNVLVVYGYQKGFNEVVRYMNL